MRYDAVIIGSGAGGSAAAWRLASTGRKVLLIEKGGELPKDGSTLDCGQVILRGTFKSREPWRDGHGRPLVPEEWFNLGGKTRWYGAALLRFAPAEFEADAEFDCPAWPLGYEQLAPYYELAESRLQVRRFEPEADLARLAERIEGRDGFRAEPLPLALAPEILDDDPEAEHFDGFASVRGYKFDASRAFLDDAAPQLTIAAGQAVTELVAAAEDPCRLSGVRLADGRVLEADQIILAAGALHSPRLLQRYLASTGLATRLPVADAVGRRFKRHLLTALIAVRSSRQVDRLRKTLLWSNPRYPHSSIQPLGFGPDVITALVPRWAPRWLARRVAERAYGFFLQTEDGSDPRNRVIAECATADGLPVLDYDPARTPAAVAEHRALVAGFHHVLHRTGWASFAQPIPLAGTAHACGTLPTGHHPALSVVDGDGRVHGLANLWVADGSILPRSSRVNPSLTIYAWALRLADHLVREAQHG